LRQLALVLLIPALTLTATSGRSKAPPGVVAVSVEDHEGHPLQGVIVLLTASPYSHTSSCIAARTALTTPANGKVSFEQLAAGRYSLVLRLPGYFNTELSDIPVALESTGPRLPAELVVVLTQGPTP